ncbi:MAG: 6-hydroxymethylpterin diphosphokinase MptE-like protein [Candidatus Odinarchaeia archaeon]
MLNELKKLKERFLSYWYPRIKSDLGFNEELDLKSAKILSGKINHVNNIVKASTLLKNRNILIFAPGPSLEMCIKIIKKLKIIKRDITTIAVDGAFNALIKYRLQPDIIVTDLDGINVENRYLKNIEVMFIHAHGDNIPLVEKLPDYIIEKAVGTCQVDHTQPNMYNIGGFTDGDRAICLCEIFKVKQAYLIGMDFGDIEGVYSKPYTKKERKVSRSKRIKFDYAIKIIKDVTAKNAEKYCVLFMKSEIDFLPFLKFEEFKKKLDKLL